MRDRTRTAISGGGSLTCAAAECAPCGDSLIQSDYDPLIRSSVEKLGFKFGDIKILLISHAHWDHDAGSAMM